MPYWNMKINHNLGHLGQHALDLIARQKPEFSDGVPSYCVFICTLENLN